MEFTFTATVWHWRGPAPHYFVTMPEGASAAVAGLAPLISYGWGAISAIIRVNGQQWTTAIFPKESAYIVPLKIAIREFAGVGEGDSVTITVAVDTRPRV